MSHIEPNPKIAQEMALEALRVAIAQRRDVAAGAAIYDRYDRPMLSQDSFRAWHDAVCAEYDRLAAALPKPDERPRIVCLCGSSRFRAEHDDANRELTMAGHIVLGLGSFSHSDGHPVTDAEKAALDKLHFAKIDLADEVFVVNPGGYIGTSTANEIAYAAKAGKPVRYLVDVDAEAAIAIDVMQAERNDERALAETVVRLQRWLAGRQGKVHSEISTTSVIAEPRDRSTAAWAIAESDVAAVVAALEARIAKGGT